MPNVLLNYSYDAAGNLLSVTDTINGTQAGTNAYTYDVLNRATRITQSGTGVQSKRVDMSYDAVNRLTGLSRYGDLAGTLAVANSSYSYDLAGRLTNLTHKRGANTIASYGFTYDAANRITQSSGTDGTQDYSYDDTNQLTAVDHSTQADEAYSYDANGNRTNAGYGTGTNNQLLTDGVYNYQYDDEGNRTRRVEIATGKVTEYVWDYRNRLSSVLFKDAAGVVTKSIDYIYDGNNQRIGKSIDGVTTERFVYDRNQISLVFDGSGTQTHRYLYGTQVDQILADERGGSVVWALADNLGTVRDVVDGLGMVLNHVTYDSYGRVISQTTPAVEFRYGFTGREQDSETGLDYYRARYYDSAVGRFISEDPIGFDAGDGNLYRYVRNSPTNFVDPSGLEQVELYPGENLVKGIGTVLTVVGAAGTFAVDSAGKVIKTEIDWSTRPGGWANGGPVGSGTLPIGIPPSNGKSRPIPIFDPNDGNKNKNKPAPARPQHTGNNADLPQFNPNDAHKIPPFVVPHKPHTGHEGCKPDWLSPQIFRSEEEDPNPLTRKGRQALGNLEELKDMTIAEGIKARGGTGGNVRQVADDYQQKTVAEIANLAAAKDPKAVTALKMLKQAKSKSQKYGGK